MRKPTLPDARVAVSGPRCGGLAEWSNAPVLKTGEGVSPPRVRIPEPPPYTIVIVSVSHGAGLHPTVAPTFVVEQFFFRNRPQSVTARRIL